MTRKDFELIANAIRVTKNTTEGDHAATDRDWETIFKVFF